MSGNEASAPPTSEQSALHSRLAALLFSDIVDSTGMKSRVSTSTYAGNLQRHNALFEQAIAACRDAKIIKHTGDGFFAQFHTASDAARCALKFQRDLASETWPGEPIHTRIGIHMGEIAMVRMLDRTDIVGSPADVAARVMSLGSAGQVLLSKLAADEARRFVDGHNTRWARHGHYKLKGLEDPIEIWEIADACSSVLPAPIGALTKASSPRSRLPLDPERIGPYRIVEPLGEGGMGTVFKAEQRTPVKRTVALKLIKLGLASREVIARFESERQALARMDHPHVAKVFDAGQDELGRPYFVMEYVPGVPITQFADDNKLPIRQRLELFIQVCDAIAHAHTKAIIHRDIKASNVLAYMCDGKPLAKVIDFGIAKAMTGDRLTDLTFNTERGRALGTYESMSPEQADGSPDIDTRTDVYSLGVLLYELLSGSQPFEKSTFAQAADNEIRRIIREVEPPRPSTRLTSLGQSATRIAELRREQLDHLCSELRSELEWIPLMAMRKERDRRYASAAELADDVGNYLRHRPLIAGPESKLYRARKYLKRNKWPVVTATAAMLGVITIAVALMLAHDARVEATAKVDETLRKQNDAAVALLGQGELPAAQAELIDAIDKSTRAYSSDDERTLQLTHTLAAVHKRLDKIVEAKAEYQDVLQRRRKVLGNTHRETLRTMNNLAAMELVGGRSGEAWNYLNEALSASRANLKPDDEVLLAIVNNTAEYWRVKRQWNDAEQLYQEAYEGRRRTLGDTHRDTLASLNGLGVVLRDKKEYARAEPIFRQVLTLRRRTLRGDDPETIQSMHDMGWLLALQPKRIAEGEPLLRDVYETRLRVLGPNDPSTIGSKNILAMALRDMHKYEEAELLCRELYQRPSYGSIPEPQVAAYVSGYGVCLARLGRYAEAEEPLLKAHARLIAAKQQEKRVTRDVAEALALVYAKLGRSDDAARWNTELTTLIAATQPVPSPTTTSASAN
jgi:eukaryotic-like serine/threonine-protein kinase